MGLNVGLNEKGELVFSEDTAGQYNANPENETISSSTATAEQTAQAEKKAYDDALAARSAGAEQNLTTLRGLMDAYKPETPEERAAREKRDRVRDNLVAASSMGAALGNLITASSKDGRAVKTLPLNEGLDKEKQKERTIRDARDERGMQLRNQYMSMRQKMLDDQLANTWNAYKTKVEDDRYKRKLDYEKAKADKDRELKVYDLAEKVRHNMATEAIGEENAETARNRAKAYINGITGRGQGNSKVTPIVGNQGEFIWQVPTSAASHAMFVGNMATFLTIIQEKNRRGKVIGEKYASKLAELPKNSEGELYKESLMMLIGEYANDIEEHKAHQKTWEAFCRNMKAYEVNNGGNTSFDIDDDGEGDILD